MSSFNFFLSFHNWNALLCPPIGFCLNLTLFWLILYKTPKEMWVHSRVLLQTCILDILLLVVITIGGYTMVLTQPWGVIVFFEGYLIDLYQMLWLNQPDALQNLMLLSAVIYHLDVQMISGQFLYRFLVLNRGMKISFPQYLLFLLPPILVNLALAFLTKFTAKLLGPLKKDKVDLHGLLESEQKPVYISYEDNEYSYLWTLLMILSQVFFYAIIIYCGRQMVRFVAGHAMTEKLKKLNRQLSRNLIILAAYPIAVEAGISIFIFTYDLILSNPQNDFIFSVQLLLTPLRNWISIFNPIVSIWTFRPYRDAVLGCFKHKIAPVPAQQ